MDGLAFRLAVAPFFDRLEIAVHLVVLNRVYSFLAEVIHSTLHRATICMKAPAASGPKRPERAHQELGGLAEKSPKSLMRMFGPNGNLSIGVQY